MKTALNLNLRKSIFLSLLGMIGLGPFLKAEEQPNILFFFVDDLGWKDLNCYGGAFFDTPVADQLAADGMRFMQAYASPTCTPTRASLISGQNSARHGMWEVIGVTDRPYAKMKSPPKRDKLEDGIRSYANVLNDVGYVCGMIGKTHFGRSPVAHGFTRIDDRIYDPELKRYAEENDHQELGVITANSIEFLRENKDRPFLLCVSHHMVHAPLSAREELTDKYHRKLRKTGVLDIHPTYAAMVEMTDQSLGLILDELESLGLSENTIVILYSDNGGMLGDMYLKEPTPLATTMAPLRWQKGSLYEGGIRVPLIVKWPGKVEPGSISNELVDSYDLFSTFIEMGGGQLPESQVVDGLSLVPLLTGEAASLGRDTLYWHFPTSQWTRSPAGAIRKGDYKLIEHYDDGSIELFNLSDDIGETVNLRNLEPEKADELLQELRKWRASVGAEMPTPNPDYDPVRAQELGYHKWLE
jgi:uncharacterized sulfatase